MQALHFAQGDPSPALELTNIRKQFGEVQALAEASLVVRAGTVHALLGENGAGKTTLMRIAYGLARPDAGMVRVAGQALAAHSAADAITAGVGMVHQHFTLVPAMTVQENIALGGRGLLNRAAMVSQVKAISARTGFTLDPDAVVGTLPVSAQQRVEIAKALARNATLLILDEPTAVLAPPEVEDLLRWLREYVSAGNAAVLITHKLREALLVADDVTVLRRGRTVLSGGIAAATADSLTHAMIGDASAGIDASRASPPEPGPLLVEATRISVQDAGGRLRVRDASFVVHGGELIGVAGVEGAGQRELLRALAGRATITAGTLDAPAIVGFIPEDRHHDGVMLQRTLVENVALRGAGSRRGRVPWTDLSALTTTILRDHDVRAAGTAATASTLSGGNQQKLVLARELVATPEEPAPELLVAENPTRGLDVRASNAVHHRLRAVCERGGAVVVYSSDLDEVLSLATRLLVLFNGSVREVPLDRNAVGRAMLGVGPDSLTV